MEGASRQEAVRTGVSTQAVYRVLPGAGRTQACGGGRV